MARLRLLHCFIHYCSRRRLHSEPRFFSNSSYIFLCSLASAVSGNFVCQATFLLRPILHFPGSGTRVLRFSTAADTWGCAGSWGFSASELRRAGTVDWGVVIGLGDSVGACWESKNSHGTGCRAHMVRARISNSDSNHVCDGRGEPEPGPEALGWDGGVAASAEGFRAGRRDSGSRRALREGYRILAASREPKHAVRKKKISQLSGPAMRSPFFLPFS
jgi:hypothetical protein